MLNFVDVMFIVLFINRIVVLLLYFLRDQLFFRRDQRRTKMLNFAAVRLNEIRMSLGCIGYRTAGVSMLEQSSSLAA